MTVEAGIRRSTPEGRLRARARAHRRRFARALGVGLGELDAVTSARLASWATAQARLDADAGADAERFWRAHNATARALKALEERCAELGLGASGNGRDPAAALRRHVAENYPDSPGHRSEGRAPKVDAAAARSPQDVDRVSGVGESPAAAGVSP